ncbi:MAG: hypothetical protein QF894_10040, partial [Alphaproteobacteria bacterium]|nr:hypothetical protein [Alphaproteobacteria bacterium]
ARLMTLRPSMAAIGNWSLVWWHELSALRPFRVSTHLETAYRKSWAGYGHLKATKRVVKVPMRYL